MTIGEAADVVGMSAKAIRLWESRGLLPNIARTGSGYRMFTDADIAVLRFIRQAKVLGLALSEIKDILDLQQTRTPPCGRVLQFIDEHVAEIDRALADLHRLRRTLAGARDAADLPHRRRTDTAVCRIIEGIDAEGRTPDEDVYVRRSPCRVDERPGVSRGMGPGGLRAGGIDRGSPLPY